MRSSLMNCIPSSVPSWALGPDLLGRVTFFLNREIFGIKAVDVRSEWYRGKALSLSLQVRIRPDRLNDQSE
jgi:hypothetical protein